MRSHLKILFNAVASVFVLPFAVLNWIAKTVGLGGTESFLVCGQFLAIIPGLPGMYLRRAYYRMTLDYCAPDCHIGFGTLFAHCESRVESNVYIGNYAMLGHVNLEKGCLIGSRASILSGMNQHQFSPEGVWLPSNLDDFIQINIGQNSWIGEAAVVMADVGKGAAVSAGSVVSNELPDYVVVAGNPARFVRKMEVLQKSENANNSQIDETSTADVEGNGFKKND